MAGIRTAGCRARQRPSRGADLIVARAHRRAPCISRGNSCFCSLACPSGRPASERREGLYPPRAFERSCEGLPAQPHGEPPLRKATHRRIPSAPGSWLGRIGVLASIHRQPLAASRAARSLRLNGRPPCPPALSSLQDIIPMGSRLFFLPFSRSCFCSRTRSAAPHTSALGER